MGGARNRPARRLHRARGVHGGRIGSAPPRAASEAGHRTSDARPSRAAAPTGNEEPARRQSSAAKSAARAPHDRRSAARGGACGGLKAPTGNGGTGGGGREGGANDQRGGPRKRDEAAAEQNRGGAGRLWERGGGGEPLGRGSPPGPGGAAPGEARIAPRRTGGPSRRAAQRRGKRARRKQRATRATAAERTAADNCEGAELATVRVSRALRRAGARNRPPPRRERQRQGSMPRLPRRSLRAGPPRGRRSAERSRTVRHARTKPASPGTERPQGRDGARGRASRVRLAIDSEQRRRTESRMQRAPRPARTRCNGERTPARKCGRRGAGEARAPPGARERPPVAGGGYTTEPQLERPRAARTTKMPPTAARARELLGRLVVRNVLSGAPCASATRRDAEARSARRPERVPSRVRARPSCVSSRVDPCARFLPRADRAAFVLAQNGVCVISASASAVAASSTPSCASFSVPGPLSSISRENARCASWTR